MEYEIKIHEKKIKMLFIIITGRKFSNIGEFLLEGRSGNHLVQAQTQSKYNCVVMP